jgi:Family of unknown function (DUF6580)
MNRPRFWFLVLLVLLAAASRLVPHPPNSAPIAAVALFGGATFGRRWSAFLIPLAALLMSDLILHLTYLASWQPNWGFYQGQWAVYACCLASVFLGSLIRRRRTVLSIAMATVASSIIFFLVTNLAVWAGGTMYPRTAPGLLLCYEMALPFFRSTLAGDIVYSAVLFGTLALAEAGFPMLREPAAQARVV